jgi:hypothetical protein
MLKVFILFCLLSVTGLVSQNLNFLNDNFYSWPDNNKHLTEIIPDSLKKEGAVILKDDIELNFSERYIKRRQAVKILNEAGLDYFSAITLPQEFDITRAHHPIYKQGRFSGTCIPYIHEYAISYFAARIIRNKTIIELPASVSTTKLYWVQKDGERIYDYAYDFNIVGLQVNDIIEYSYKADIKGSYGTDQFYVNDYFPKLKSTVSIRASSPIELNKSSMVLNHNIDSTCYSTHDVPGSSYIYQSHLYKFKYLKGIKYAQNSQAGKTLAHITASPSGVKKHFFNATLQSTKYVYSAKYSWFIIPDSLYFKERIYNRSGSSLRRFVAGFPDNTSDSSKCLFFSRVTDTINHFNYLSAEQMHYGKDAQYALSSAERLAKRQLTEEFMGELYNSILFERNVFYYIANVQDRRFGYHTPLNRSHEDYEAEFIALPVKNYYKFYVPRFHGMTYFPDELPFYYESAYCALIPKNTQAAKSKAGLQEIRFIKTPTSSYNDNVRTENAVFKVNLDSLVIHASIKENLNGQFSTILRHYYNNACIDSTIKPAYFKRCTEKPKSVEQRIQQASQSQTFPFRASYLCSASIPTGKNSIDLSGWFSFLLSGDDFKDAFTHDYMMDFTYTDTYNFLFEFNKPVSVSNAEEFNKSLSNELFEITAKLDKQENNKYLLCVTTKVKQYVLPANKFYELVGYVNLLKQLNSSSLTLSY